MGIYGDGSAAGVFFFGDDGKGDVGYAVLGADAHDFCDVAVFDGAVSTNKDTYEGVGFDAVL